MKNISLFIFLTLFAPSLFSGTIIERKLSKLADGAPEKKIKILGRAKELHKITNGKIFGCTRRECQISANFFLISIIYTFPKFILKSVPKPFDQEITTDYIRNLSAQEKNVLIKKLINYNPDDFRPSETEVLNP